MTTQASRAAETLWAAAQALNRAAAAVSPAAAGLPPLLFLTDPERTPRPWETVARLPAGSAVVFRGFGRPQAPDEARRLRQATRARGVRLLIGLDADLAEAVGADGVHLPERARDRAADLRVAHPSWLLTGAAHGPGTAGTGLDALVVSPVFAPGGLSGGRRPALGIEGFAALIAGLDRPAYALGGVTAANAGDLARTGACGLAAIDGITTAFGDAR